MFRVHPRVLFNAEAQLLFFHFRSSVAALALAAGAASLASAVVRTTAAAAAALTVLVQAVPVVAIAMADLGGVFFCSFRSPLERPPPFQQTFNVFFNNFVFF